MGVLDKNNKKEIEKYNEFIVSNETTSVMQTMEWAKLKSTWNYEVVYTEKDNKIVMSALVLIKRIPGINMDLFYIPRGPIGDLKNSQDLNNLLKEIDKLKEKYKPFMLTCDPQISNGKELSNSLKNNNCSIKKHSAYDIYQPKYNFVIKVNENMSDDDILKNFSSSSRTNVRKSIKKGCTIRVSSSKEDLQKFFDLHYETGKRSNFITRPYKYYETLLDLLGEKSFKIFLIENDGICYASNIGLQFGNKLWYLAGGTSMERKELKPSYLVQFSMFKYCTENNLKYYELGGVYYPDDRDPVYTFKRKLSTDDDFIEYIGEIQYVYNKFIYVTFNNVLIPLLNVKRKAIRLVKKILKK